MDQRPPKGNLEIIKTKIRPKPDNGGGNQNAAQFGKRLQFLYVINQSRHNDDPARQDKGEDIVNVDSVRIEMLDNPWQKAQYRYRKSYKDSQPARCWHRNLVDATSIGIIYCSNFKR